jgi:hypothetical protein
LHAAEAAKQLDETKRRIADFGRSARLHGFDFNDMNDRKGRCA